MENTVNVWVKKANKKCETKYKYRNNECNENKNKGKASDRLGILKMPTRQNKNTWPQIKQNVYSYRSETQRSHLESHMRRTKNRKFY